MNTIPRHAEERILQKANELGESLTQWAREELLVGIGYKLHVTIELREEAATEVEFASQAPTGHLMNTEGQWEKLFKLPWNASGSRVDQEILSTLRKMKEQGNKVRATGYGHAEGFGGRKTATVNQLFRSRGFGYKLISDNLYYRLYELK